VLHLDRTTEPFTRILHDASSSYASGFYCVTKNANTTTTYHIHENQRKAADKKLSFLRKILTGDKTYILLKVNDNHSYESHHKPLFLHITAKETQCLMWLARHHAHKLIPRGIQSRVSCTDKVRTHLWVAIHHKCPEMWVVKDEVLLPCHVLVYWLLLVNQHPVLLSNPPRFHSLAQCNFYLFPQTRVPLRNMV
jgi:hypothetical protein